MLTKLAVFQKSSLSFALGRVKVRLGNRVYDLGLSKETREQIVGEVAAAMLKHGNWPELREEPPPGPKSGPR